MATNNVDLVTTGSPKVGGAVYAAPIGSTLPTDESAALDAAFVNLGYISEDGYSQKIDTDSQDFTEWGGDQVGSEQTSHSESYSVAFIEQNEEVFRQVYGDANVTKTAATGALVIKHTAQEHTPMAWVIDEVYKGSKPHRLVIPNGKITAMDDISHDKSDLVSYPATITALPDSTGTKAYEYFTPIAVSSQG